jgi:hypothetical protein
MMLLNYVLLTAAVASFTAAVSYMILDAIVMSLARVPRAAAQPARPSAR